MTNWLKLNRRTGPAGRFLNNLYGVKLVPWEHLNSWQNEGLNMNLQASSQLYRSIHDNMHPDPRTPETDHLNRNAFVAKT